MESNIQSIIRYHRKLSGLSRAELARLAGVGKTVIFDIEHGKQSVQLDTLQKVFAVLNIRMVFQSPALERAGRRKTTTGQPT
jgi:HTH-type transcriptional regulator / antitoxin HipB